MPSTNSASVKTVTRVLSECQAERFDFTGDRAAPVDDRTENIEGQKLNIGKRVHHGQIRREPDLTGGKGGEASVEKSQAKNFRKKGPLTKAAPGVDCAAGLPNRPGLGTNRVSRRRQTPPRAYF